jgi:hypothetical protein
MDTRPQFWAIRLHAGLETFVVLIAHPEHGEQGALVDYHIERERPGEEFFNLAGYLKRNHNQAVILYTADYEPVLNFASLSTLQNQLLLWSMPNSPGARQRGRPLVVLAGQISALNRFSDQPKGDWLPPLSFEDSLWDDESGEALSRPPHRSRVSMLCRRVRKLWRWITLQRER